MANKREQLVADLKSLPKIDLHRHLEGSLRLETLLEIARKYRLDVPATDLEALRPFSDGSRYLNFAGFQEEGDAMMQDAFANKYQRLAELKAKYDPTNLFRLNQNIKPAQS